MSSEEEKKNEESEAMFKSTSSLTLQGEGIVDQSSSVLEADVDEDSKQRDSLSSKDSWKRSGRPPRRPPPGLMQTGRSKTTSDILPEQAREHHQVASTGDYSFLSGLTDDEENEAPAQRNRTISFDERFFGKQATPPLSIDAVQGSPPPPPPVDAPSPKSPRSSLKSPKSKWSIVREQLLVHDVKAPFETEAEDAILRVVEKNKNRDASSTFNNILPHVSKEAEDVFQQRDSAKSGADKTDTRTRTETSEAHTSEAPSKNAPTHHRRNCTALDETLFELATQMQRVHDEHEPDFTSHEVGRQRLMTAGTMDGEPIPTTEADTLVKNAAVLFQRKKKETVPDSPHESERADTKLRRDSESKWQLFSSSDSLDAKKTDVENDAAPDDGFDVESGVDVETGVSMQTVAPNEKPGSTSSGAPGRWNRFGKSSPIISPVKGAQRVFQRTKEDVKEDWGYITLFLRPRAPAIQMYIKIFLIWIFIPAILTASILFYAADNPGLGREGASTSWFLLFLLRCAVTGTLAKASEVFIIDFLSLQLRATVRVFGPIFTLLLVQAKGYPFILFMWGLFNFCMNSGRHIFARHWLFWQAAIELFNDENPAGTITFSRFNYTINGVAMGVGVIVAVKRLGWGFYIGKRSYLHYGDELARVIKHMLLVSEVASLSKEIQKRSKTESKDIRTSDYEKSQALHTFRMEHPLSLDDSREDHSSVVEDEATAFSRKTDKVIYQDQRDKLSGSLTKSQKIRLAELLGQWEEPETAAHSEANISIASILQFRQMLAFMDEAFPFSLAFGPADTRDACVESAQKVYERLMLRTPDLDTLPFETIGALAINGDDEIDRSRMKDLLRLFRPNRDGDLNIIDFVKSCDAVYRNMRMLRASIANSGQVDRAFEIMVDVVFWIIMFFVILAILGFDPMALFLSLSSIILAFAFMVGSASAKYFEGILFILVRRPYDIGDRVAASDVNSVAPFDGSATWFVQGVDLFTTTVRYAATNEVATIANGSLASSRVINAKRSPKAVAYVYMRFSVDVPYHKVQLFRSTVESFVKERPREWIALSALRATKVEAEKGYVEYVIVLAHRESWQNIASILQSKADVASYCNEVAKKLGMSYAAPPLPVKLSLLPSDDSQHHSSQTTAVPGSATSGNSQAPISPDIRAISALFKQPGAE